MPVLEILDRAVACCARVPASEAKSETRQDYRNTFARMWREPALDPLRPGQALNTFYHRRAALHFGAVRTLKKLHRDCLAAAQSNDVAATQVCAAALLRALDRIEPALDRDPPGVPGEPAFNSACSRWRESEGPHPPRGENSKKHVIGQLPRDWAEQLWQVALEKWNKAADRKDLDALAVALNAPVRPEEFVPGQRPDGWSDGVVVELKAERLLHIVVAHVKSHKGRYGTGTSTTKIDPIKMGGAAAYLAARCAEAGGRLVINVRSKNASRKKLGRLGKILLPEDDDEAITPYVLRNQVMADFKATLGAGAEVAAAAGQCTDRTQAEYGNVAHGRKRKGLIGVDSTRKPRAGNVARARELGAERRPRWRPRT
jgi:hypothetical protein